MGTRTTNGKNTFDTNIYQLMEALMIRGITFKSSQHQVPCIVILSILEYLVQNCVCVCVCVRAREHVCVIFILKVVFRKLSFIKYMGGIMLKEALLFLLLFFPVFLDYVKYKYYRQQQFLQQKNKKNKEKKRRIKTIKTN